MQEQDGKNQFNISQRLEDLRRDREALRSHKIRVSHNSRTRASTT
jgi:hypothetical protein